ncbi:MAG: helix-turn-helix domain-containing protein [Desulfovibrionaceae bacterium]|nr:helix-turn-helix domain-containing protein [Desulfovibrionaceae bacterium]
MTQAVMAERGEVGLNTQNNYEGGRSVPNADYLGRLAALGLDVLYVVTGQRTPDARGLVPGTVLDKREAALLDNYRSTDEKGRRVIDGTANLAAQQKAARSGQR